MSKRFPLQPLQDLSGLRLEQATRQLGQLITGEREHAARLALLLQYRQEYHALFLEAARKGLDPASWHNYRVFLGKLDEAIEQARQQTETAKRRTAAGQQNWLEKRGRVKAYDTLAQRFRARIAYEEARQAQKESDEHAARRVERVDREE